ncbi:Propeptide PepSY amd peptidase M4 [Chroococcidiopsis thermalis PCC 7203]|uniref:Propeptide PepSY amd peptidase M4 n=1 Tax=Chroococcidiopsis thermalis (strain PCC 7203) TaxID=251229 RepID=K9TYB8_CHRTP|nr:Propeptide PepSY amd peptidase M4 [Chroococcidiopsis thermalis PCC 7203]
MRSQSVIFEIIYSYMRAKRLRNLIFSIHRYIGLAVGLILILIGITGSLLVFHSDIDDWIVSQQFGVVIPQGQPISIDRTLEIAQAAHPQWKAVSVSIPKSDRHPFHVVMEEPNANPDIYLDGAHQVFVNPYTEKVMGDRLERFSYYRFLLNLHYRLFVEQPGVILTGTVALFLLIAAVTGTFLWSGWRKLSTGFKIKWKAHIKRRNFDLHKVVGITTAVFLSLTAITGFGWNFSDFTYPAIRTVTFSPIPNDDPVTSKPISGQAPITLTQAVEQAKAALPGMQLNSVDLPGSETGAISIYGLYGESWSTYGVAHIDRYNGKVLQVEDSRQPKSLGDRIINSFFDLHVGTFWGLPSRFLYVLVGFAPLVLFITGVVMWQHRRENKNKSKSVKIPVTSDR